MPDETFDTIPMNVWAWLWMRLADLLGPEHAAELCIELRRRIGEADRPTADAEREVGGAQAAVVQIACCRPL